MHTTSSSRHDGSAAEPHGDGALPGIDDPRLFEGVANEAERDARRKLLADLLARGTSVDELAMAVAGERLATLPVEYALGADSRLTIGEVAIQAGVDLELLRDLWRALGHALSEEDRVMSEDDVESAKMLKALMDAGIPREGLLEGARVIGHSISRVADAIKRVGGDAFIEPGDNEYELAMRYEQSARALVPMFAPLLHRELQVHMREQIAHDVVTRGQLEAGSISGAREIAIGFADLSGFTRLGEEIGVEELGDLGSRFGHLAADVATGGVELVKMIGDGAMFAAADARSAVAALVELVRRAHELGDDFPPARAGVAFGEAVPYGGDWFGSTVNRASRICGAARADSVLVDEATRAALGEETVTSRPTRKRLKGITGSATLFRVDSLTAASSGS